MRTQGPLFAVALTILAGSTLTGTVRAGGVSPTWHAPQSGSWNNALFWNPAAVPLPSQTAILPHAEPYTVTMALTNTVSGLTISNPLARLDVNIFVVLTMQGPIVNDGTITLNPTASQATFAAINYTIPSSIGGSGRIRLGGISGFSQITTAPGVHITHESPHIIDGIGFIQAAMTNNSTIRAADTALSLTLGGEPKTNNNLMEAQNGATLNVNTVINQSATGLLRASGPGSVLLLRNAVINGGTIDAIDGGVIATLNAAALNGATNLGNLQVRVFDTLSIGGSVRNDGRITINPSGTGSTSSLTWTDNTALTGQGTVTLAGQNNLSQIASAAPATIATFGPDQRLEGIGNIAAPLTMHGTLAPGLSVGTMEAIQPVTMTPTAVFEAEVAAQNNSDRLTSNSTFHADGTLEVHLVNGFNPAAYWTTSIVTAAQGITGRFDQILAPTPADPRLEVRARYLPTEIRVGAFCKADFNADTLLNFFDVSDFIALYNLQDPSTDLAPPFGVINFFDLSAYLTRYNQGCP